MLESAVEEEVTAILLACVFEGATSTSSSSLQSPPATVESAVLQFFNFLSFHDFDSSPLIVRGNTMGSVTPEERAREAAFRATFSENRDSLPALAVLLPYGAATAVTKSLSKQNLRRLINLARQVLHAALSTPSHTQLNLAAMAEVMMKPCDLGIYDIVIQLKPLQVPSIKENRRQTEEEEEPSVKKAKHEMPGFLVVDFDPVGQFLDELRNSYRNFADFYYGRSAGAAVGVKLRQFVTNQVGNLLSSGAKRKLSNVSLQLAGTFGFIELQSSEELLWSLREQGSVGCQCRGHG